MRRSNKRQAVTEMSNPKGRPQSKITKDNYRDIYFYFNRAVLEYRSDVIRDDEHHDADEKLTELSPVFKEMTKEKIQKFQEWIDTYVLQDAWQKCLQAIRQKRYSRRRDKKTLHVSGAVYKQLKECARKMGGKTLEETIGHLVIKQITRLRRRGY